jgi:6-phosphogluconolactonase (cycloisomerase 2 family)
VSEFEKGASGAAVVQHRSKRGALSLSTNNLQRRRPLSPDARCRGAISHGCQLHRRGVAVLPVLGAIWCARDNQHHGSSVNTERQQGPHVHSVVWIRRIPSLCHGSGPRSDHDLQVRPHSGKLTANACLLPSSSRVLVRATSRCTLLKMGLRNNELDSTVTFHLRRGAAVERNANSLHPANRFSGENSCAEIEVGPSGKFVTARTAATIALSSIRSTRSPASSTRPARFDARENTTRFAIDPAGGFYRCQSKLR